MRSPMYLYAPMQLPVVVAGYRTGGTLTERVSDKERRRQL